MNKDKCRCTEKLGLGGLGSLMEKLQHSECSVSLVYRVETWCYCVQLNKETWVIVHSWMKRQVQLIQQEQSVV